MEIDNSILTKCYQLLKNVLLDAFNVSASYFTPPYGDIQKIDQGIRAAVWTDYSDSDTDIHFWESSEDYRILIIKSNLGFYNIMVTLNAEEMPDFIAIGPFRDEELTPNYFIHILKESHISPTDLQRIKQIYERMPFAHLDAVVNVTKHILGIYIPELKEVTPELLEYSEGNRAVRINSVLLEKNSIEESARYQELLFNFLGYIKSGDNALAKKALQDFLHETKLAEQKNMRDFRIVLQTLNDYCHMTLLQTSIHPSHILKQAISINNKIANITSLTGLMQMPNEICHKYCLIVKNYANPEYSKLTRDVIAYIQLHLEEELSLNSLSSHFGRNSSVLSNTFSKETGQTLTKFIHQTRIQEALLLLNTTSMSVSEVAMAVGYQDFSYFSKVFSKNIGCSPQKYKQQKHGPV